MRRTKSPASILALLLFVIFLPFPALTIVTSVNLLVTVVSSFSSVIEVDTSLRSLSLISSRL